MNRFPTRAGALLSALAAVTLAACGGDDSSDGAATTAPDVAAATTTPSDSSGVADADTSATGAPQGEPVEITMALGWTPDASYAEYYAAREMGYYDDLGLDVTIMPGGSGIVTSQIVAGGQAEFGNESLGTVISADQAGANLVSVSQSYAHMAARMVSRKEDGILTPADWKGKTIGMFSGNQRVYAVLAKYGLDPDRDVTLVDQGGDQSMFINGDIDIASGFIYSGSGIGSIFAAGLLPDELNMWSFEDDGATNVEGQLYVNGDFLAEHRDAAVRFVAGTLQGQIYCRDNPDQCVQWVLEAAPSLVPANTTYSMTEMNKLRWPNGAGIGAMDQAGYELTAQLLADNGVIDTQPEFSTYADPSVYADALALLPEGTDLYGADFVSPEFDVASLADG